jgi:putative ABC transport system permease protein
VVGIAIGVGVARFLSDALSWPTLISTESVLLSFGFASLVGIFFGFYPAQKAARLDPIEALRYE